MKPVKIFTILIFCALVFALAAPVLAAASKPQYNPQCWQKKDCLEERKNMGATGSEASAGWIQEGECVGDWGKCLAGKVTVAEVSFGGNKEFRDIGVYIKTVYNYSLVIIGILAVVMIVIAGAQWTSSAGNAEVIGSAKKRITGAIIGLFIAFMSYNILNTINPATINLRLPQVWLLRSIALGEPQCSEQKDVALDAALPVNQTFFEAYKKLKPATTLTKDHAAKLLETICGVVYDLPNGDKCRGSSCVNWIDANDPSKTCGPSYPCACFYDSGSGQNYCKGALIGGVINLNKDTQINDWYIDYIRAGVLCGSEKDGYTLTQLDSQDPDEDNHDYGFTGLNPDVNCGPSPLVGYFLTVEVHDAESLASVDDDWVVGKNSCGAGGMPLAALEDADKIWSDYRVSGYSAKAGVPQTVEPEIATGQFELAKLLVESGGLWTKEMVQRGATCDLITNVPPYNRGLSDDDFKGKFYITP